MELLNSLFPGKTYREIAHQILNIFMIVTSAFMSWKALALITNSESPIVVVLSESMEPAFHRGDLLFLSLPRKEPYIVGDIVVYKIEGQDIPIVHRILKIHKNDEDGEDYILTKGDNNNIDDRALYNQNQLWIKRSDIIGKVKGFLPYIGYITIVMSDYPKLKYLVLGVLTVLMFFEKEEK